MAGWVVAAATVGSAVMQYRAGQYQAALYKAEADKNILEGRTAALQHKLDGNKVLDNTLEQLAYANAFAGANLTDPFTGSKLGVGTKLISKGVEEWRLTETNSIISKEMANYQAAINISAGKTAKKFAYANAALTLGQGVYMGNKMGIFKFG